MRCRAPDCSGVAEYDDNAQAVLCTTCGVVVTQDVLTERDSDLPGNSVYFGPTTLRSLRRVGHVLVGQSSKEDRDRRNTIEMHKYMSGLLNTLAYPGLAPRAHSLFDQARVRGKYRWGRKSLLVAGACIAAVLRENKKGVTMTHLAAMMDVPPHSLCRIFTHVNVLLSLQLPLFDPVSLLPGLQSHLKELVLSTNCPLPLLMVKIIQPLPPAQVLQLATCLATLIGIDEASSPGSSVPATACALLLLALEGQATSSLPSYMLLAFELGKKAGASKNLVVSRYRDICDLVKEWMKDVPWILSPDDPDNIASQNRRKTSQRNTIAIGLKDVVQFKEDILQSRKAKESECQLTLSLDIAEDEDEEHSTGSPENAGNSPIPTTRKRKRSYMQDPPFPSKSLRLTHSRRARPLTNLEMASLALLSPSHPLVSDSREKKRSGHASAVDDLQTQILTRSTFPNDAPPTRLQGLVNARGSESHIGDDELFEEGELEGLLRSEEEIAKLRDVLEWPDVDPQSGIKPPRSAPQEHNWDWDDAEILADLGEDNSVDQDDLSDAGAKTLIESRQTLPYDYTYVEADDDEW